MNVLITTVPFGDKDNLPLELLKKSNLNYKINPLEKKLNEDELIGMIKNIDILIAGTENITSRVINSAPKLKHISRVGIGLDSVDLIAAKKKDIKVSYTPDAPSAAVSELTIGMIISSLRSIHISNNNMHKGQWHRLFGRRLSKVVIGIIGVGRIGSRVIKMLNSLGTKKILANDISDTVQHQNLPVEWVDKDTIFREADVISLHLPLNIQTKNLIRRKDLNIMKKDSILINTSRGGIVNENDLYNVMKNNHLSAAAIDVFEEEPYNGILKDIDRCLLTAHMGSMSIDCRTKMEIQATEDAIRFFNGEKLKGEVPFEEYEAQGLSK